MVFKIRGIDEISWGEKFEVVKRKVFFIRRIEKK